MAASRTMFVLLCVAAVLLQSTVSVGATRHILNKFAALAQIRKPTTTTLPPIAILTIPTYTDSDPITTDFQPTIIDTTTNTDTGLPDADATTNTAVTPENGLPATDTLGTTTNTVITPPAGGGNNIIGAATAATTPTNTAVTAKAANQDFDLNELAFAQGRANTHLENKTKKLRQAPKRQQQKLNKQQSKIRKGQLKQIRARLQRILRRQRQINRNRRLQNEWIRRQLNKLWMYSNQRTRVRPQNNRPLKIRIRQRPNKVSQN